MMRADHFGTLTGGIGLDNVPAAALEDGSQHFPRFGQTVDNQHASSGSQRRTSMYVSVSTRDATQAMPARQSVGPRGSFPPDVCRTSTQFGWWYTKGYKGLNPLVRGVQRVSSDRLCVKTDLSLDAIM